MGLTRLILVVSLCCLTVTPQLVSAQVVPDAARRHMDRGQAALEMAKSTADLDDAVRELQKAVELAPDWADPYYSLGMLQNRLERFDDALKNLARYLQLAPNAGGAQEVKQLINKIEYRKEKAEKDRKDPNSLVGTWWVNGETNEGPGLFYRIEIRNINGKVVGGLREFSVTEEQRLNCGPQFGNIEWDGTSLVIPGTYYFYCDKSVQLNCCPAPARLSLTMVAKDTLKGKLRIAPYKHRDGTRNPEWTEEFVWKRVK